MTDARADVSGRFEMTIFEIILTLAISLGAVIWGVNIYNQKGTWFLAGWNTMKKEEKASYNEEAICHLFGRCVVFCGIGIFLVLYGRKRKSSAAEQPAAYSRSQAYG